MNRQPIRIERHRELESTQTYCLERAEDIHGVWVVLAENQMQGMGRKGSKWISSCGSLTFSMCIENVFLEDSALLAAHCIKEALERSEVRNLSIKWPNDLCIDWNGEEKKVCGVIVNTVHTATGTASIIGVGLNISGNIPYFTLADAEYKLDKEQIFTDAVQILSKKFLAKKSERNWLTCFAGKHIFLDGKRYEIASVKDSITLSSENEQLVISSQEYSYCAERNMLLRKSKHAALAEDAGIVGAL